VRPEFLGATTISLHHNMGHALLSESLANRTANAAIPDDDRMRPQISCSSAVQPAPSLSSSSQRSNSCGPTMGSSATQPGGPGGPCLSNTAIMPPTFATLSARPVPAAASGRMKTAATSKVMRKAAKLRCPFSRWTSHA
jgi:hypothetical protein